MISISGLEAAFCKVNINICKTAEWKSWMFFPSCFPIIISLTVMSS